jgi:ATP-dependent helicase YprA (DUF1998 family)
MNVFELRDRLIRDYGAYVRSFIHIRDERVRQVVEKEMTQGLLWPEPLIQLNPAFAPGESTDELVTAGVLHPECRRIFRIKRDPQDQGKELRLHRHQADAVKVARAGASYVLTTGTGSGKSLAYIIPIVDRVLREGPGQGVKAIVVYPMNALANSQEGELGKFLRFGYPDGKGPVTFARYTGQESESQKEEIIQNRPDILLTNYVMLELILTRVHEQRLVHAAQGLRFLVLDELHTYRGRQGADVAMLVRRAREAFSADHLQCVGTSATLATEGTFAQQQAEVARVASQLFGTAVAPDHVIGETLRRTTKEEGLGSPEFVAALHRRLQNPAATAPREFHGFVGDPLSGWIESTFGVTTSADGGRLVRSIPRSISGERGAAKDLSRQTGVDEARCVDAIQRHLMDSYECEPLPGTDRPVFAFRLHQFISRGDMVYASPEEESRRHITVHGQQFVPGSDRKRVLLPLVFCRVCGLENYCVEDRGDGTARRRVYSSRELSDRLEEEDETHGFLFINTAEPWPTDAEALIQKLPEDWLEDHGGSRRIRRDRRKALPRNVRLGPDAGEVEAGVDAVFIPAPFRFCLTCGVAYGFRQSSDFPKLAILATEGRATATTIMSLAVIRHLLASADLPAEARKLLSFTDNRQDASLQAGHFNDFIEIGLLRSALFRACDAAGADGLTHDYLVQRVFDALDLDPDLYAVDSTVRFQALEETKRALRSLLGYRIYRDLQRGWRVTSPNLEQSGLLEIRYSSLDEVSAHEATWGNLHPILATARPHTRMEVARTLLDHMRRELAIKVDYLRPDHQERIRQQSSARLKAPWEIDENERMTEASVLFPRASRPGDYGGHVYLSPRGQFGQYLRRQGTFPDRPGPLSVAETEEVIRHLLQALKVAGIVEEVLPPRDREEPPGYQINTAAMTWHAGDGTRPFHDPIRVPRAPATGGRTNPFFVEYYKAIAADGAGLEAREHTAAVRYQDREDRERRFREGTLPILYCSPTMELGVDIAKLNVVNMRNIPPTPANYAQRSGRAGRSGQPALVFSYCSTFSSHDQYFFARPERMVGGSVSPPRIDLTNEDLIRSHVHAIWLAEVSLDLGKSLKDLLDLSGGDEPSLEFQESVRAKVDDDRVRSKALDRSKRVLETVMQELRDSDWYTDLWLPDAVNQVGRQFDQACERWRGLYRSATRQRAVQHAVITDASRSADDKNKAKALRAEAEAQIELLTEAQSVIEADFYSYRYFASEGFLPGYNFPRLPLSAYIPGRREKKGRNEFLSRPRFLAISEFGPRSIIYHEGSRYRIHKAILPVERNLDDVLTTSAKRCDHCGYLHPISDGANPDLCEHCGTPLAPPMASLFRLQNVATKRADKINSDEEERRRIGFELVSSVRFAEHGGSPSRRTALARLEGQDLLRLTYGQAATIWRMNLGWRRRAERNRLGFVLDIERGFWETQKADVQDDQDPMSQRTKRVVPYVEDRRNCLLIESITPASAPTMASLQAAIKHAIQVEFQLEEMELAAEPLPSLGDRRLILLYEAAEGGAGVLRKLVEDPAALGRVATQAIKLCHFDPATGEDHGRAERAREECEAACYDCLMSYSNQIDHEILDRKAIRDLLLSLQKASVQTSPTPLSRPEYLERLLRQCGSELEKSWLRHINDRGLRLPSRAQHYIETCRTKPDFIYEENPTVIYVDGPPHDYPDRRRRDETQAACLEDHGYTVIRFVHHNDWAALLARYPGVFGKLP